MSNASQKRTKRAAFLAELMSSTPASTIGWLATTPTVRPSIRQKPVMMFAAWAGISLEEVALVGDLPDQLVHVIGRRRARRDERVEAVLDAVDRVLARPLGLIVAVRQRQEVEELARCQQRVDVVLERDVGDARLGGVRDRSAQARPGSRPRW